MADPAGVAAGCRAWTYAIPTPKWVSDRAVALLAEYHARPGSHTLGDSVYEWGQDGKLYRYYFTMHPPDPENPLLHPGVEASYCTDAGIQQPSKPGGTGLAIAAAALVGLALFAKSSR